MVGSTIHWPERIKGYKKYRWYSSYSYEHRVLWEGSLPDDECLGAIRAVKEATWIGRMETWSSQDGHNQMNPVAWYLGNPDHYTEMSGDGNPTKRPEVRAKISAAHTGKIMTEAHRRNLGLASTGRKHTEETRRLMSESALALPFEHWDHMRGDRNPAKSLESRNKIKQAMAEEHPRGFLGKHHTDETKQAQSKNNAMKRPEIAVKLRKPKSEVTKSRMKDGWINRKRSKQPDFFDIWESQHELQRKVA